jgi:hypothetical protein
MLRGLIKMAAIAGAGLAWRKFRNRNTSAKSYDRNTFGAKDRPIGTADRTGVGTGTDAFGGSASSYGTAGSSSSYSTGAGSGAGTGSLAGSGTSGMTGGGSVGSSGIRTNIGE